MQTPVARPLSARQESDLLITIGGAISYTSIIFSRVSDTYDPETGYGTDEATATVAGKATEAKADLERYAELGLVLAQSKTLLFQPDVAGEEPELGSSCTWGGLAYTVKGVVPVSLSGSDTSSIATVVISR